MECLRRFFGFLSCRRKRFHGGEYVLLKPTDDVDLVDLDSFIRENFSNLGIARSDLVEFDRESEVTKHLLRLLPVYRQCMLRHTRLDQLLTNHCRPHLRSAAEVEQRKSKRVMEMLDVIILKLLVGEFSLSDDESVERLLEKFSMDQSTLCEVEKIARLVDLDREKSGKLLDSPVSAETETDAILLELQKIPPVPEALPSIPIAQIGDAVRADASAA